MEVKLSLVDSVKDNFYVLVLLLFTSNLIIYFYFKAKSKEYIQKIKGLYNKISDDNVYIQSLQKTLKELEEKSTNPKLSVLREPEEDKEQKVQELQNIINENHTEIVILNSTIENYKNQIDSFKQKINRLEKDIYIRTQNLEKKENTIQELLASKNSIDKKLLTLGENVQAKEKDLQFENLNNYKSKVQELQNTVEELRGTLTKSHTAIQEREQIKRDLEKDLNLLNSKLTTLEGDLNRDKTELTLLKDKISDYEIDLSNERKKNSYLQTELENANIHLRRKDTSIKELNSLNDKLNKKIINLEKLNSEDNLLIRNLKNDIKFLKSDIEETVQKQQSSQKNLVQTNLLMQRKDANIIELNKLIQSLQDDLKSNREEKELLRIIGNFISTPSVKIFNDIHIDRVRTFIINELIPLLEKINVSEKYNLFEEINKKLNQWESYNKKPWLKEKIVIAVMGQFNAGKSTFINSILEENLLPIGAIPTTAIPSYITYGSKLDIDGVDFRDEYREFNENHFDKLNKEFTESYPLHRIIKHFVIRLDKSILKGKTFLDIPGIQSLDESDKLKAIENIEESDVVFWLLNITDGDINQESIRFLKENIKDKVLYIVINQADRVSPNNIIKVQTQIEESLKGSGILYSACLLYSSKVTNYKQELMRTIYDLSIPKRINFGDFITNLLDLFLDTLVEELKEHKEMKFNSLNLIRSNESAIQSEYNNISKMIKQMDDGFKTKIRRSRIPFIKSYIVNDFQNFVQKYKDLKTTVTNIKPQINGKIEEIGKVSIQLDLTNDKINYYEETKNELLRLQKRFRLIIGEI